MSFEVVPEQPEEVPGRPIAWTLAATVGVVVASVFIVWALAAFQLVGGGASPSRVQLQPPAAPFSDEPTPVERQRGPLDTWEWSDRAARRVRVPIDIAIDRYVEQRGGR
jgi:hypothetical protein